MGAPCVIAVPSKSYVVINSYKSSRSLPPTLCDLGRVSNIAAVVTLPRTANLVSNITRSNIDQGIKSLPNKKRPISEVTDCVNSNSYQENVSTASSTANATASHKKRRCTSGNHPSTSTLVTQYVMKTDLDVSHDSNPKAKEMKLPSIEISSIISSPNGSSADIQNISSVSFPQNTQRNPNNQAHNSKSTNSPPRILCMKPVEIRSQETGALLPQQINQQARLHAPNANHLPTQQSVQIPTPGMEQLTTYHSNTRQLQQQNQQLRNENVQLQKQLSLFRQLMKNPQRLNQVITRLEQRVQ